MGKLRIDLLGASFTINANEDEEYLNKLLGYYKRITAEIEKSQNIVEPVQIAILSGIMICDELYKEKTKLAHISKSSNPKSDIEIEERIKEMIKKIDQGC